jgi:hypothetical protein
MQTMTSLRWLAAAALVLAVLCRAAWRHIPFALSYRVSPEVTRGIAMGIVFFWGFLFLSVVLALISFFRHARGRWRVSFRPRIAVVAIEQWNDLALRMRIS